MNNEKLFKSWANTIGCVEGGRKRLRKAKTDGKKKKKGMCFSSFYITECVRLDAYIL